MNLRTSVKLMPFQENPLGFAKHYVDGRKTGFKSLPRTRKSSLREFQNTVPQTNAGGLVEYTKVIGITKLKELGKTAGVTSG